MKIFENNEMITKLDDLDQAILLFEAQNKYVTELSQQDCVVIAGLLKKLKQESERLDKMEKIMENSKLSKDGDITDNPWDIEAAARSDERAKVISEIKSKLFVSKPEEVMGIMICPMSMTLDDYKNLFGEGLKTVKQ